MRAVAGDGCQPYLFEGAVSLSPDLALNLSEKFVSAFSVCAVTRAQSKRFEEVVDLSNSYLVNNSDPLECVLSVTPSLDADMTVTKLVAMFICKR